MTMGQRVVLVKPVEMERMVKTEKMERTGRMKLMQCLRTHERIKKWMWWRI